MGLEPVGNGEPVTGVNAPHVVLIEYTEILFEPLFATNRNFPLESMAKAVGFVPGVVREDDSVRAPELESIPKREMSPLAWFAAWTNFFEGWIETPSGVDPPENGEP